MTEVDINSHHYEKKGFESINLSQNQPVQWWRFGRCMEVQVLGDFQALWKSKCGPSALQIILATLAVL